MQNMPKESSSKLEALQEDNFRQEYDHEEKKKDSIFLSSGLATVESARNSINQTAQKLKKSDTYNRVLYDNQAAKNNAKKAAFEKGIVQEPYTGAELELRIADATAKYGEDWTKHLAEADHVVPLKKLYEKYKSDPFLTDANIRERANSDYNIEVTGRQYNNAKRDRTNKELVTDDEYLGDKNLNLTEQGKKAAIRKGRDAKHKLSQDLGMDRIKNTADIWHEAGMHAGKESGMMASVMSGIMNITAVIRGEKDAEEALADTAVDTIKGAATGYVMGGGLTVVSHSLSYSSSKFIQALSASNVPGKVITTIMTTGDVLKQYGQGEISTQECILALGEKGINCMASGYSMALGQALIPIPIIGAAIGALVGSTLAGGLYQGMIGSLQKKELEHQERQRIIAESKKVAAQARAFRLELESYLVEYFKEYQDCFDEALVQIRDAFQMEDADGIIAGANQITKKLGGTVYYETAAEFEEFLFDDSVDIL